MKRLSAACYLPFLLNMASAAKAEPVVFIESYHNLDYAKVACERVLTQAPDAQKTIREFANNPDIRPESWLYNIVAGANECKSVRDFRQLGRQLENELTDALAVNIRCAGVTVIRNPHPQYDSDWLKASQNNTKLKNQKDYWNLHLDYNPGHKIYRWALFPNKAGAIPTDSYSLVSGEGDTAKVADQICIVVTRSGTIIR